MSSRYELKPYMSQYVDPQSTKIMEIYRERYDKNKAKMDTIDRAYANIGTFEGDKWLLDESKAKTKGLLKDIAASGRYEDAGLAIDDAIVELDTNQGLIAAKKSYDFRQKELEWRAEMTAKGINTLDFGKEAIKNHKSWVQDEETGEWKENIYRQTSQVQHNYQKAIKAIMPHIIPGANGLSQDRMNRLALELTNQYIYTTEGKQHKKMLEELQYDQSIPLEQRQEMAYKDIIKAVQVQTNNYVHSKAATLTEAQTKRNEASRSLMNSILGTNEDLAKPVTRVSTSLDDMDLKGWNQGVLSNLTEKLIKANQKGDKVAVKDLREMMKGLASSMATSQAFTPEEAALFQKYEIEHWAPEGSASKEDMEAFAGLMRYMTDDHWMPDFTLQMGETKKTWERIKRDTGIALATGVTTGSLGITAPFSAMGTMLSLGVVAASGAGELAVNLAGQATDGFSNIRSSGRAQYTDLGFVDSEHTELMQNVAQIRRVNEVLGTKFVNEDVPYLQELASKYYSYKTKGEGNIIGDDLAVKVNDFESGVFDTPLYIPSVANKDARNNIDASLNKNYTLSSVRLVGIPEDSPQYKKIEKAYKDANNKMSLGGMATGTIKDDKEPRFVVTIDGNQYLAESKVTGASGSGSVMGDWAESMGLLHIPIMEDVRQVLVSEEDRTGEDTNLPRLNQAILKSIYNGIPAKKGLGEIDLFNVYNMTIRRYLNTIPEVRHMVKTFKEGVIKSTPNVTDEQMQELITHFLLNKENGVILNENIKVR